MKAFKLSPPLDTFQIIQLMAKSLCTDKFPLMKKLNFPKMINCWSNFPQLHFLGGCVCWPGLSCQFPHNSTSWPRTPVPFSQIFDQNHFILASFWLKLRFLWPCVNLLQFFRVLEWTFSKCWRGVVDLKGIPNVWTQRIERGDGTNDKWQIFVWRKNLRSPF